MESRVALIGIIIEDPEASTRVNEILHEHGQYIVGRMGIPYRERSMNIMSIVVDAPQSVISAISGKIGSLRGVTAKTSYSKTISDREKASGE